LKNRDFSEKEEVLARRLAEKKALNYRLTNDYFEFKHSVENNKQRLEDQLALARVENEALKSEMDKVIESQKIDGQYSERVYEKKSHQFAARFRKVTQKDSEELNIVKVKHTEAQDIMLDKLKNLEHDLKQMTKRGKMCEAKRHRET
jgi:hypothetical protein